MEKLQFIYEDNPDFPVEFEPIGTEKVMVNATQMAKIFGKQVESFIRNENTKAFIKVCLRNENSRFLGIKNEADLVITNKKYGTWMHRILALKFAAWLDPAFDLWVYTIIDRIINHYFREQRDAMIEKITVKARKEALREKLLGKYPEIEEYFKLEALEKQSHAKRMNAVTEQFKQLKMEFDPPKDKYREENLS